MRVLCPKQGRLESVKKQTKRLHFKSDNILYKSREGLTLEVLEGVANKENMLKVHLRFKVLQVFGSKSVNRQHSAFEEMHFCVCLGVGCADVEDEH
jgi:hypothetical protein